MAKIGDLEFDWDETKRRDVIRERRVDMVYAARIFWGEVLTRVDDREDYGEVRLISVGMVEDECFVVVHTESEGRKRLITAWKGGRHARSEYQARVAGRDREDE